MIDENTLIIYTDGSSLSKPSRRGGIGVRFIYSNEKGEEIIEELDVPGYKGATNNQMELFACTRALIESTHIPVFPRFNNIIIRTDSLYVVDNYPRLQQWSKSRWCNQHGRPIDNAELWKNLLKTRLGLKKIIEIQWVKGHAKDVNQKAVDKLAKKSAMNPLNKPLKIILVRRKLSPESVELHSVPMLGQRLTIRIITSEYLRLNKINKYKYEVVSKASDYYKKLDIGY